MPDTMVTVVTCNVGGHLPWAVVVGGYLYKEFGGYLSSTLITPPPKLAVVAVVFRRTFLQ